MSQETTGYELPAGDAFEDELCCAIVYYPDREEYRRALLGALTYFATWIAWERDSAKRGADAARSWQLALDKTLECWNMACMEDLIAIQNEILTLLQSKKDCCDTGVTYDPQETVETDIDPGVGDPPDFYGQTAITTWDEWEEHVCYNAHVYVDNLISAASQLVDAVNYSWIALGLVAALMALATMSGIGIPIAYGLAATVVGSLAALTSGTVFTQAATDIETARDDIVCAFLQGTGLADAVETAIGSGVAWTAFYQFLDYATAEAIVFEGGHDGEYLPTETRDDCTCDFGEEPTGQLNGVRFTVTDFKTNGLNSGNMRSRNADGGRHGLCTSGTKEWGRDNAFGPPNEVIMNAFVNVQNDPDSPLRDQQYSTLRTFALRESDAKQMYGVAFYHDNSSSNTLTYTITNVLANYGPNDSAVGEWYEAHIVYRADYSTVGGTVTVHGDGRGLDVTSTKNHQNSDNWVFFDVIGHGDPLAPNHPK